MEHAVVGPDPGAELLVDPNTLWLGTVLLVSLGSSVEEAVLGGPAVVRELGLVHRLRFGAVLGPGEVMALVDEGCPSVFQAVVVRGIRPDRHEDDGVVPAQAKVHAPLEAGAFPLAHLEIGDDLVGHA